MTKQSLKSDTKHLQDSSESNIRFIVQERFYVRKSEAEAEDKCPISVLQYTFFLKTGKIFTSIGTELQRLFWVDLSNRTAVSIDCHIAKDNTSKSQQNHFCTNLRRVMAWVKT